VATAAKAPTGSATRREKDTLGDIDVPAGALWGAQTQRAVENYPISGYRAFPAFVRAITQVKKAEAIANAETGRLDTKRNDAIVRACDEILGGQHADQFVVDVFHSGAGVSFHMNANEVIANRANQILGGGLGTYEHVNPNDHVNMGQSTNDVTPTAMRLAHLELTKNVCEQLDRLADAFDEKAKRWRIVASVREYDARYGRDMQRHFRDSRLATIGGGTSEIQRNIIAQSLGL